MKTFLLTILVMTVFAACKKENNTNATTPQYTKTQNLTLRPWHDSLVYRRDDSTSQWMTAYTAMQPCKLDDNTSFKTDFTYINDEGVTKCDPAFPQIIETGGWAFTQSETHLDYKRTIPNGNGTSFVQTLDWKIEQLDDKVFIYSYFYYQSPEYYRIIMVH